MEVVGVRSAVPPSFPSGTLMVFQQTSAPTGWTKQTTHNDKAIRIVSGTPSSGGTVAFSTVFGKTATDSYTLLSPADIPSHGHKMANAGAVVNSGGSQSVPAVNGTINTGVTGSDGGHSHGMDIRVQYVDMIIASKD